MSETSTAILDAKRRARDYWDIDGLPALLAGAVTVLLGAVWMYKSDRSVQDLLLLWFFFYPLLESKKILEWLKSRITYPRTGYVAPPKEAPYSRRDPYTITSIIKEPVAPIDRKASRKAIGILKVPLLVFVLWFADFGWMICVACLASALLLWQKYEDDPPWFEIAGAAIAGLVILPVPGSRRLAVLLLVFGAASMVKGAKLLIRYLRQHPAPQA